MSRRRTGAQQVDMMSRTRWWLVIIVLSAPANVAWGQDTGPVREGVNVGRFILRPSLTIEQAYDSNVLFRSMDLPGEQIVSSGTVLIRPRLVGELPLGRTLFRVTYAPQYRDYTSDQFQQSERISHFFDLEGIIRMGPSLTLVATDHVVRATVELEQVDEGGELVFGLVPFKVHEPQMEVRLALGARHGLSFFGDASTVSFGEGAETVFFDYKRHGLEARYNYSISVPTTLYVFARTETTNQHREQSVLGDVDLSTRSTGLGLRRVVNQAVAASLNIGYEALQFEGTSGNDFAGPYIEGTATWRTSDTTRYEGGLTRRAYQSFFVNNNYYVVNQLRVRRTQQIGRSVFWDIGLQAQASQYADRININVNPDFYGPLLPSQGRVRRDRVLRLDLGVGVQLHPRLRVFLGYNEQGRRSNLDQELGGELIDPFHYRDRRFLLRLEMGWL